MKKLIRTWIGVVLLILTVRCHDESADAPISTSAPVAPNTTITDTASNQNSTRPLLPSWSEQIATIGLSASDKQALASATGPQFVDVTFEGPILHITSGATKRAVVLAAKGHYATLTIPPTVPQGDVKAAFANATCTAAGCDVPLNEIALRLIGANNAEALGLINVSNSAFVTTVPHLGGFIASEQDFHADVVATVPPHHSADKDKIAAAFFDISRGVVLGTVPNGCMGKFNPGDALQAFAYSSTFRFTFATASDLLVRTAGGTKKLRLSGFYVPLTIHNEFPGDECTSHFEMFEKVAKNTIDLPPVMIDPDCENCPKEVEAPGCGNTQWP